MKHLKKTFLALVILAVLSIGWRTNPTKQSTRVDFGKIYLTDTHLLVSELLRGINIYNVTNFNSIRSVGYIPIEGNADVIVTDNTLYADSYEDLLIYDYSNPEQPILIDSVPNIFRVNRVTSPIFEKPTGDNLVGGVNGCAPFCASNDNVVAPYTPRRSDAVLLLGEDGGRKGGNQTGQGGSMARFVIKDGWLYCIDITDLIVFDIRNPQKPKLDGRVKLGFGIETLFWYDYFLFVGSQTGMQIFNAQDVKVPVKVGEFRHARACDPVVVEGKRAYVTLRSGNLCGPADDALHIIDITDVKNPLRISSYLMEGPTGLAVENGNVFVCDKFSVYILDVKDETDVKKVSSIAIANAYDTIYHNHLLFIVAPMGIYIFNVADRTKPIQVAHIPNIS